MAFTQIITVKGADEQALKELISTWDREQSGVAPGYQGARVLADSDGRHLVEVDFSSREEAERNNDRPETQAWAERLREIAGADASYQDLRQVYATYGQR